MLSGELLVGQTAYRGKKGVVNGVNPATGAVLEPSFGLAESKDVARACELAWNAFDEYREAPLERRAVFLELIAENILSLGDELIERAMQESGLPRPRLEGERARTVGQLRLFAEVVREGSWIDVRIDNALPDRKPMPRSDLRLRNIPVGPVVVFGASNFPLAFSVAGGDTASAFAAGCPVIVKAHSAHPGTSELVGKAIRDAVTAVQFPEGVFSLLFAERDQAIELISDPRVKSVGFTGSRAGGLALVKAAANRAEPIPVFAEMASINPVFLLPGALAERAESIGKGFVSSLTMSAGQLCTNPGLILALEGEGTDRFLVAATDALGQTGEATMLTPGIHQAYQRGVSQLKKNDKITLAAAGTTNGATNACQANLFVTTAESFLADPEMHEEIFGAAALVVVCKSQYDMRAIAEKLEGQLTATLQMSDADGLAAHALLPALEKKAGRILINGFPTGVEVCHAMVHGGPFPATSDPRFTSVGTLAIRRFLRPVCYQDFPDNLLPDTIKRGNPLSLPQKVDGKIVVPDKLELIS
ncbi:MAG: 2-ketoglutarate semialdehyde dehydrogenase [Herminiimonas sp.]|nr:2-ketoglutarate semialdehyde dehydrogenase [Herminiimonas sp.]